MERVGWVSVLALLALTGCNGFESRESKCLKSERLNWKDPDSVQLITNLGDRGRPDLIAQSNFWVRYKAKNGYGAYAQGNILCGESSDGQVVAREKTKEYLTVLDVQLYLMKKYAGTRADPAAREAEKWVYELADNLPPKNPD